MCMCACQQTNERRHAHACQACYHGMPIRVTCFAPECYAYWEDISKISKILH